MLSSKALEKLSMEMANQIFFQAPVVTLEKLSVLDLLKLKTKSDNPSNEEPKRKKFKTGENKGEIPKLILLKNGNSFQSKLKFSNPDMLENVQEPTLLSSIINRKIKFNKNQIKKSRKKKGKKKTLKSKMKQPIINCSLIGKIKVCDVDTINKKYDTQKNINCFDGEEPDLGKINNAMTFEVFGTDKQTIEYFKKLHKKYFSKSMQDTTVIINNIIFINLLTNMHCVSLVNVILTTLQDKYVMAKNIQFQTMLHIKYIKILDEIIKNNCIDVISAFEDSHFEHALLMFILSLFTCLKVFGSNILKNSSVLLKKLKKLDWTSVKKENVDPKKIEFTLNSDIFCSTYYRLSQIIGEGSHTDPYVIQLWELFYIQPMIKTSYFHLAVEALLNDSGAEKLISSIDQASNKIRSETRLINGQNSLLSNKIELKKLISMVNNSSQGIIYSNDTAQPSTSGFNNTNEFKPAQAQNNENKLTPHIFHTNSLKTSKPDRLNENFPYKCLTNIPETLIPNSVQFSQVKNSSSTSTPICIDLTKPSQDLSTPHIFHTSNLRTSVIRSLNMAKDNFINMPETSVSNQGCPIENTLTTDSTRLVDSQKSCKNALPIQSSNTHTPSIIMHTKSIRKTEQNTFYEKYNKTNIIEANATSTKKKKQIQTNPKSPAYIHKKFGYIQDRVDQTVIFKIPKIPPIKNKVNSNTSAITMDFDRSEKCIGFTIRVHQWSIIHSGMIHQFNSNSCLKNFQVSNIYKKDFNDCELIIIQDVPNH